MDAYTKKTNRFGAPQAAWETWTGRRKLVYNTVMENTAHQAETLGTPVSLMSRPKWMKARYALAFSIAEQLDKELT